MNTSLVKITRLNEWKNYIIPFLLGIIFLSVYIYEIPFNLVLRFTGLFLVSIFGTAAYGYFLNNIFDLKEDRLAGKSNFTGNLSWIAKTSFVLIFIALALVPWLFLPTAFLNFGLFVLQLVLLTLYSLPTIRFKRLVYAGVIIDALYNSVIMVLVIVFTVYLAGERPIYNQGLILAILIMSIFLKGFRGILLHQLADRKNNRKSGLQTFVLRCGPLKSFNLINRIVLPIEILFNGLLTWLLSKYLPGIVWLYSAFLFYKALKFRFWNIRHLIRWEFKFYRFVFLQSMNDWYEEWLPMFALVLLAIKDLHFLFLLIPYVLLFPAFFIKLYKDIPETVLNFKNDFNNKFLVSEHS